MIAIISLSLLGCSTSKNNAFKPNPAPIVESKISYEKVWQVQVGKGYLKEEVFIKPAHGYGKIFVTDVTGKVMALSADEGKTLWSVDLNLRVSSGLAVANELVVLGTRDGEVIALSETNGEIKWRTKTSSEIISSPAVGGGYVVITTVDGLVYALNAEDGKRLWFFDRKLPELTLRGGAAPVIVDSFVFVGFANGKVAALLLEDGRLVFEKQVAIPKGRSDLERLVDVDTSPLILGQALYVGGFNGNIAYIDIQTGETRWQKNISVLKDLSFDGLYLLVTHADSLVSLINRNSGETLWTQKNLKQRAVTSLVAFGDHLVTGDYEGYLYQLDKQNGAFLGRFNVGHYYESDDCFDHLGNCKFPLKHNGFVATPLVVDETLITYSRSGMLLAFKVDKKITNELVSTDH